MKKVFYTTITLATLILSASIASAIIINIGLLSPAVISSLYLASIVGYVALSAVVIVFSGGMLLALPRSKKFLDQNEIGSIDLEAQKKFSDVAISDEVMEKLKIVCESISEEMQNKLNTLKYEQPKGYLFYGPPGTGKTLLARVIAGETNRKFINVSASEFVSKYAGHGVDIVKKLFAKARKNAPCIVFIDEIDAIGAERTFGSTTSQDRVQTLNQLLTEMDGFKENKDIVVIAATNCIKVLDSALIREGRFSEKIFIPLPDSGLRKQILDININGVPSIDGLDLTEIANKTDSFSGAKLSHLANEAKLIAANRAKKTEELKLTTEDFNIALEQLKVKPHLSEAQSDNVSRLKYVIYDEEIDFS
ncbi:ATP-binding protein [Candidatus Mesenet endosymbiont of Phosphuga atrata]|uniref:ATP-binding protein n=1 Tax=Candidatus Mesenet endosymbiont of Phosphuga atrata TaxID=3066221 RepID=UPI0030D06FA7